MRPSNLGRKFPAEVLTAEEVERLIKASSTRAPTGVRNRALIVCLYRCGLRISEALNLYPKDLDRDANTIRVLEGKGGRSRTVGMDSSAFTHIERWLDMRPGLGISNRSPVFCTLEGDKIKTPYIRALLPRLAKRAGVNKRVHAHCFRHSHASELASEGIELRIIAAQLGHSHTSTTDRYIQHLNPTRVIDAIRKREWNLQI